MSDALGESTRPGAPTPPAGPSIHSSMGLLEHAEVEEERVPGDGDRFAHPVRHDKANSSMVTGQPIATLCGKMWIPSRDASKYPVCLTRKEPRDSMGCNGQNWPFLDEGMMDKGFSGGSGQWLQRKIDTSHPALPQLTTYCTRP